MAIDWSKAPEGAEFYANGHFRKRIDSGCPYKWDFVKWVRGSWTTQECRDCLDYSERQTISVASTEWPETDERIDNIGRNRTEDDLGHYDDIREQHEAQPAAPQQNKYDRTIIGKYGSGKCVVDVYRVLYAFPSGCPDIDHAVKKLLAPGKRGSKDELQDLREAIQSIEARIDYLQELSK
jgi:hypothetical protein